MKTIICIMLETLNTFLILLLLTRNIALSLKVGLIILIANTILYYLHERIWENIS